MKEERLEEGDLSCSRCGCLLQYECGTHGDVNTALMDAVSIEGSAILTCEEYDYDTGKACDKRVTVFCEECGSHGDIANEISIAEENA